MIVRFVDIGGIVDRHCLKVIVRIVDIGGIVDHLCLNFFFHNLRFVLKFIDLNNKKLLEGIHSCIIFSRNSMRMNIG